MITKIDLLPYVDFDVDRARSEALMLRPDSQVLPVSVKSGEGMDPWCDMLRNALAAKRQTATAS